MEIISPISHLVSVLEQVKKSAKLHEAKLKKNEANTRAVLIDPVIRSLGWDTSNPDMVEYEKFYKDTKLDYALNDCNGGARIIVEAKGLGINLSDDKIFTTILTYGITYRIPNIFLTDGMIWKHYKLAEFAKIDPVILDLSKDSLVDCALYLIENLDAARYWSEDKPAAIQEEIKVTPAAQIAVAPTLTVKPEVKEVSAVTKIDFIPLSALGDLAGKKPPASLRLPDGTVKEIKFWRDILLESISFVLANTPHLSIPLLDKAGKKCVLIDYQKMSHKGVIVKGSYQGKEVFIYLNYDSNHIVSNALYVLNFLPPGICKFPTAVAILE